MPLQIRRGPTADRLSIVPLEGELVYDTNTGAVYIGDGQTSGGVPITQLSAEDIRTITARQFLGPFIDDNSIHTGITFQYVDNRLVANVSDSLSGNFSGNIFAEDSRLVIDGRTGTVYGPFVGSVYSENSTLLVNGDNGSINLDGTVKGDITPDENETYDIGSLTNRFKDLYLSGSSLWLGDAQLTALGSSLVLPAGSTVNGNPLGLELGAEYAINIRGDLIGSVYPDDSAIPTNPDDPDDSSRTKPLVDATEGSINLDGTVKGDIIPDITETRNLGSLTRRFDKIYLTESSSSLWIGNASIGATGTSINLPAGSTVGGIPIGSGSGDGVIQGSNYKINIVAADSTLLVDSDNNELNGNLNGTVFGGLVGNVTGNLTGTVFGTVFGNLVGDMKGSVFADNSSIIVNGLDNSVTALSISSQTITSNSLTVTDLSASNLTSNLTSTQSLLFYQADATPSSINIQKSSDDNATAATIAFIKSRGSVSVPTAVTTNHQIGSLNFRAYDGTDYITSARIAAGVTGSPSAGYVPSQLRFFVRTSTGNEINPMVIHDYGTVTMANNQRDTAALELLSAHDEAVGSTLSFWRRSRGTTLAPTALQNGDAIYGITFSGYDGSAFRTAGTVRGVVDGAVSSGIVPGRIEFITSNATGAFAVRMVLDKDGVLEVNTIKGRTNSYVQFNQMPTLPTYADETAANAAVGGSPINGMMYYDTALSKVRARAGGSWVDLH